VLAAASPVSGVEFKRVGGLAWSQFSALPGIFTIPEAGFSMRSRLTVLVGVGFVYRMTPHFSLDVSGQYFRKGARVDYLVYDNLIGTYSYDVRALSAPVCLRYGLRRGTTPYVLGGFDVSYVLGHEMSYFDAGSSTGTVSKLTPSTRKFDFAAVFGGGVEIVIGRLVVFTELRWYRGLVNLSKSIENYPTVRTRTLSLQIGFWTKRKPWPL
jgi:hypothetical protein